MNISSISSSSKLFHSHQLKRKVQASQQVHSKRQVKLHSEHKVFPKPADVAEFAKLGILTYLAEVSKVEDEQSRFNGYGPLMKEVYAFVRSATEIVAPSEIPETVTLENEKYIFASLYGLLSAMEGRIPEGYFKIDKAQLPFSAWKAYDCFSGPLMQACFGDLGFTIENDLNLALNNSSEHPLDKPHLITSFGFFDTKKCRYLANTSQDDPAVSILKEMRKIIANTGVLLCSVAPSVGSRQVVTASGSKNPQINGRFLEGGFEILYHHFGSGFIVAKPMIDLRTPVRREQPFALAGV